MGFMDKLKGTAKQAMNPVGQMGERDKIMKINQSGVAIGSDGNRLYYCPLASRRLRRRRRSFQAIWTRWNSPFRKSKEVPSSSYQEKAPSAPGWTASVRPPR